MEITCPNCGLTSELEKFSLQKATSEDTARLTVHERKATPGDYVASCPKCRHQFIKHLLSL